MAPYKLRFHPQFVQGLENAIAYYASQSKNAAVKFKAATKKQLNLIKKNPYSKAVRYDDVRFACFVKFPYSIHFSIDLNDHCVLVHRILCDYQDSDTNWEKTL